MHHHATILDGTPAPVSEMPTRVLFEAIAKRQCVATTYNRAAIRLAPHIVYTRHGELYLDAVTVEREGRPPKEAKLGTFKLAGLGPTTLTARLFVPFRGFDADEPKYSGATIFALGG